MAGLLENCTIIQRFRDTDLEQEVFPAYAAADDSDVHIPVFKICNLHEDFLQVSHQLHRPGVERLLSQESGFFDELPGKAAFGSEVKGSWGIGRHVGKPHEECP
jgi:hypothetical protein